MSKPSQWPLSATAIRAITPQFILNELSSNTISRGCYPMAFGYYPEAHGHYINRSQHDDNLMIYCTEGVGHVETQHFKGPVKQGDVLLLPEGLAHHYHANEHTPWTVYWFHFGGEHSAELINNLSYQPEYPVTTLGLQPQLIADFKRLLSIRHTGYRSAAYVHAASIVQQILCYLAMEIRDAHASQQHNFSLDAIQQFMLERLDGDLSLDTLAANFNLSKYHFSNKYKQLTGYPPIKHFIHMKMERACYLLDTSLSSVKTISNQLGYDDPLYFSRLFRKTTGTTPTQYRDQAKG
jgi:AraC-like DNA-binding protein